MSLGHIGLCLLVSKNITIHSCKKTASQCNELKENQMATGRLAATDD